MAKLPRVSGLPFLFDTPELTTGNVFWLDSGTGSDSNRGDDPQRPFATLDYAVGQCTASNGDVIYAFPGHAEDIIAAGGVTCDVAGITIVGLGHGNLRPTFTLKTAVTASLVVSAANVTLRNLIFDETGIDSLNNGIYIDAAGCSIIGCQIEHTDSTGQADCAILTTANADDLLIQDCYIFGSTDGGTAGAIELVGGSDIKIINNIIFGYYTTSVGCIRSQTTANVNIQIRNNILANMTASSTKVVVLLTGSTGFISGNHIQILNGTAPITGDAACWCGANYYAATIATGSTLV